LQALTDGLPAAIHLILGQVFLDQTLQQGHTRPTPAQPQAILRPTIPEACLRGEGAVL
jgi:hypothetical protein